MSVFDEMVGVWSKVSDDYHSCSRGHHWSGLQSLAVMLRQGGAAQANRLEARHMEIAQRTWERAWPSAKAILVAATTPEAMESALTQAGNLFGDHLTEADEEALVTVSAQSYGVGQGEALEEVAELGRSVHWRAKKRRSDKPAWPRLVRRQVDIIEIFDGELDLAMTERDLRAAEWLANDNIFWVRDVWDQALGDRIARIASNTVLQGGTQADVSSNLEANLTQFDEPGSYWDVLANAAVQRGRSMGAMSGFNAAGVATFRFVAVGDERTSDICNSVNGTVWTIEQGNAQVDAITAASDPDELKAAAPWAKASDVAGFSASELAAAGVMFPPLHGRCRSTIVVDSFGDF